MERFWSKVDKGGPVVSEDLGPCWLWTAAKEQHGYGHFWLDGRMQMAHRVVFAMERGPIPDGHEIDHRCRVTSCVRPDHLECVDHAENMRRGARAAATHCRRGHPYTPENTYTRKGGARSCRVCAAEYRAAYLAKADA